VRTAVKHHPGIRSLLTVGAVLQAGWLLFGGAVADTPLSVRLVRVALGGLIASSLVAIAWPGSRATVARHRGAHRPRRPPGADDPAERSDALPGDVVVHEPSRSVRLDVVVTPGEAREPEWPR
jgi:hypothetical protein